MIKWSDLISRNENLVKDFALGNVSARNFAGGFRGRPNEARQVIRNYGSTEGRALARKALRRRGLIA